MDIMSLNVNGLNASIEKGLFNYIASMNPDIICLQETKLSNDAMGKIKFDSYPYVYYTSSNKQAEAGVLIATKKRPVKIIKNLGVPEIDLEARFIALEYDEFFIVNIYFPQVFRNIERYNYRLKFNDAVKNFLFDISIDKHLIICGDFNVAHKSIDIYDGNQKKEKDELEIGFRDVLRTDFDELLSIGLFDALRICHPNKKIYSWYSKKFDRKDNKGKRLDYILVSDIFKKSISAIYYQDFLISDHFAVFMTIDLKILNDTSLLWKSIDFDSAEEKLAQLQSELIKATYSKNFFKIKKIQRKITEDFYIKCLAVRHLSRTTKTSGIDDLVVNDDRVKYSLAKSITSKNYKMKPLKFLIIKNKISGKERKLGIPTAYDRAMQILFSYALDPVAEALADRKSFAFRKGRSILDVDYYVRDAFNYAQPPKYVLLADVKSCYYNISHNWLMENIPMNKNVLNQFLSSGYIFSGKLFDTKTGIMPGTSISPIIANMVLDGMQEYIFNKLYGMDSGSIDYKNGNLIRYADDIFITANTYTDACKIKQIIKEFLAERGLILSEEKTKIVEARSGFKYLMHDYYFLENQIKSSPSQSAILKLEKSLENLILKHNGSLKTLINSINSKLIGWANFHRHTEAREVFRFIDNYVNILLLKKCRLMHPKLSDKRLTNKYFDIDRNGKSIFRIEKSPTIRIIKLADAVLIKRNKFKTNENVYIDFNYYKKNILTRDLRNVAGKYKNIWLREEGKCFICKNDILQDEDKKVIIKDITKRETYSNKAYIHTRCELCEFDMYYTDKELDLYSPSEFADLYEEYNDLCKRGNLANKHKLSDAELLEKLMIPKNMQNANIPKNALLEVEMFFKYLVKKYSL